MSWIAYTSFPRSLKMFHLLENKAQEGIYFFPNSTYEESHILIVDKKDAKFDNCFINEFVYKVFIVGITDEHKDQKEKIVKKYLNQEKITGFLDNEGMNQELRKFWEIESATHRQILHDFIDNNIEVGEFVEKYTAWDDHKGSIFRHPTIEESVTLQEFLVNSELTGSRNIGLDDSHKLTIHKTQ